MSVLEQIRKIVGRKVVELRIKNLFYLTGEAATKQAKILKLGRGGDKLFSGMITQYIVKKVQSEMHLRFY